MYLYAFKYAFIIYMLAPNCTTLSDEEERAFGDDEHFGLD